MKAKTKFRNFNERLLDSKDVPMDSWTQSIDQVPPVTHSVVENFYQKTNDKRHLTQGYAYSTTKKFETSGKPMQIYFNIPGLTFLLESYTRAAMRQAKGISPSQACCCVGVQARTNQNVWAVTCFKATELHRHLSAVGSSQSQSLLRPRKGGIEDRASTIYHLSKTCP